MVKGTVPKKINLCSHIEPHVSVRKSDAGEKVDKAVCNACIRIGLIFLQLWGLSQQNFMRHQVQ